MSKRTPIIDMQSLIKFYVEQLNSTTLPKDENLELEVKVKNKILNFNIPGKFNYFELQNNKLKGITLVN